MSLDDLVGQGRLRLHKSSPEEIARLLTKTRRDVSDARVTALSLDGRFMAGYNAALSLATMVLAAAGYRASGQAHHMTVFEAFPLVMGADLQALGEYYDACRQKRNRALYNETGQATRRDVEDLIASVEAFEQRVRGWLRANHPHLVPEL